MTPHSDKGDRDMTATKVQGRFVHVTPQGTAFKDVLEFDTDEDVNDIHIYTYPVSIWVDTPNMKTVKIRFKDPGGDPRKNKLIKSAGGLSKGYLQNVSAFGVQKIDPALQERA
jgi:hypothetical protein